MTKINEKEVMIKAIKELNVYTELLISGNHPTDYIVSKVEDWASRVSNQAKHTDKYVKELKSD